MKIAENSMLNREFKGNPFAAMNAAYGYAGKYDEKDFQLPPAMLSMHNGPAAAAAAAAFYSQRMPVPSAYAKPVWRKGKWLDEEEAYTKKLIEAFSNGYLNISSGTTLRSFLSDRLSCDPMRITKKFAGSSCIGKQVFTPCDPKTVDSTLLSKIHEELKELEEKFRAKVDVQRALDYYPVSAPPTYAPIHPAALHGRMAFMEGIPSEYYALPTHQGHPLPPHVLPNPFMMKMYGQDMMPFMFPHHQAQAKYSPKYQNEVDYRTDPSMIPVVPVHNIKSKSPPRVTEEAKNTRKPRSEKKTKTTKSDNLVKIGVQGDLDASDLLLNFFKVANESIEKSRSNSAIEFETNKFDSRNSPRNGSIASFSSSTLTSASNLLGMISSSNSESENDEDVTDEPDEEDLSAEENQSTLTKRQFDEYDQYESVQKRVKVE